MNGQETAARLAQIADRLRSLSTNGLHWSTDAYQTERYQHIGHALAWQADPQRPPFFDPNV